MKSGAMIILTAIILPWVGWASLKIIDLSEKVPQIVQNVKQLDKIEQKVDKIYDILIDKKE